MNNLISNSWYQRPVFGGPVIIACLAGMFGNVGPLIYASFGFIIHSLELEFGWNRANMTLSISLMTFVSALVHPFFGRLMDRYGVRRMMIPSLFLMAVILITVPLYLSQVWHLWLAFTLVAVFGVANNNLPFIRLVATWFDKRRGFMIGVVASATGIGVATLPKVTEQVVSHFSWQGGFIFFGMFIIFFTIPVVFLCVRDSPQSIGLLPDGVDRPQDVTSTSKLPGLTLAEASKTSVFWLLFVGVLFASFALWGITNQMGLILIDKNYSVEMAASVAVALGLSMAGSRLLIGYLLDKLFAPYVGGIVFFLTAVGFSILIFVPGDIAPFIAAVLLGSGLGAETELIGFMVSRYFGLRRFGTIYGMVFVGFLLGAGGGPYLYAKTQEALGSYDPALQGMIILMLSTAVMFASMGKYNRYQHQFSIDDSK